MSTLTKFGWPRGPRKGITYIDRFWEKVIKGKTEDDCWGWNGTRSKELKYSILYVSAQKPTVKAHRISWEIHFGAIPSGIIVRHKCDNPTCTNPKHLELGTILDNNQDMVKRERHGRMKFTHEQVRRIRALYERHRDHLTHKRIAEWFGVSKATISHMMTGRNWKLAEGAHEKGIRKRRYNSKMDSEKVLEMRQRRKKGESLKSLSENFGINQSGVSEICRGKKWNHV